MAQVPTQTALTGDDLLNLPTGMGERYELVEGELISMTPAGLPHGAVVGKVTIMVGGHVLPRKLGIVVGAETGFYTRGDNYTVRAPDMAFFANSSLPASGLPAGYSRIVPDLVVEVVSPNDKADEIETKIREWLVFGVKLVWVIYPLAQTVHIYTNQSEARILSADDTLDGGEIITEFSVSVKAIFEV